MSDQLHVQSDLPARKSPCYLSDKRLDGPKCRFGCCIPAENRTLNPLLSIPQASHFTDWGTSAGLWEEHNLILDRFEIKFSHGIFWPTADEISWTVTWVITPLPSVDRTQGGGEKRTNCYVRALPSNGCFSSSTVLALSKYATLCKASLETQ
jgi:hypothetical protein